MNQQFQVQGTKDAYIVYDKVLGKGAYGVVLYAQAVNSGNQLAAKIISKKSLSSTDIVNLRNEIQIQSNLCHSNVVAMLDAFEDDQYLYMLLEYCNGGCLFTNIQLNGPLREEKAAHYFSQVVRAINYLHSKGVLHRDIKLSNLLITNDDQVKLADFTWSTPMQMGYVAPQLCGTLEYMPPEVMNNKFQNEKLDIWSLGIVLYEMLHNDLPKNGQIFLKHGISEDCKKLMRSMLEVETYKRPTTTEILQSEWIKRNTQKSYGLLINTTRSYSGFSQIQRSPQNKLLMGSPLSPLGSPLGSPIKTVYGTSFGSPRGSSPFGSPKGASNSGTPYQLPKQKIDFPKESKFYTQQQMF